MIAMKTGSLAAVSDTVSLGSRGESMTVVGVNGTHAGYSIIIEGSIDGTTWFPLNTLNTKTVMSEFGAVAVGTNATKAWLVSSGLWSQIRIRCTARSSGTMSVVITQSPGVLPTDAATVPYKAPNVGKSTAFLAAGTTGANSILVASGPGILNKIVVNTAGATAGMIVYDNATTNSGTILYTSAATHALGVYELNLTFQNGITVRKASATAAACFVYTLN